MIYVYFVLAKLLFAAIFLKLLRIMRILLCFVEDLTFFTIYDKICHIEVITMKSTGIVRSIDKMGRIVLPMETRKLLNLTEEGSSVEIYIENDMVILKKYAPACIFCNNVDNLVEYHGVKICENCINDMSNKAKEIL